MAMQDEKLSHYV